MTAQIIEMDADRRRLSLSLNRVSEGDQPRPLAGAPLGLSEEVFGEGNEEAPDLPPEEVDESIDADSVAPDVPGPGDSDAGYPAPPDENE